MGLATHDQVWWSLGLVSMTRLGGHCGWANQDNDWCSLGLTKNPRLDVIAPGRAGPVLVVIGVPPSRARLGGHWAWPNKTSIGRHWAWPAMTNIGGD